MLIEIFASGLLAAGSPAAVTEDEALRLVLNAAHQLYRTESARCFSAVTEATTPVAYEIAVRENHKAGCGGDPDVMPVRDRFRVDRSGKVWLLDPADGTYLPCQAKDRRPICPER